MHAPNTDSYTTHTHAHKPPPPVLVSESFPWAHLYSATHGTDRSPHSSPSLVSMTGHRWQDSWDPVYNETMQLSLLVCKVTAARHPTGVGPSSVACLH